MASQNDKPVPYTAGEKNAMMNEERTFLTQLLESALAGDTQKVLKHLKDYCAKSKNNNMTTYRVLSQFKDGSKRTAFHFACQSPASASPSSNDTDGKEDIVVHLLTKCNFVQSQIDALIQMKDKDGLTPLMLICQTPPPPSASSSDSLDHHKAVILKRIQTLLSVGNKSNIVLTQDKSDSGATALHYAAMIGSPKEIITTLYKNNKDNTNAANIQSNQGGTPLHWAAGVPKEQNFTETMEALINDCNANVDGLTSKTAVVDSGSITPLIFAAASGNDHHAKLLIDYGADWNVCLDGGITVYHICADMNLTGTLETLLEKDAKLENLTDVGDGSSNDKKKVRDMVLEKCMQKKSENGATPLDLAIQKGNLDSVMILMNESSQDVARTFMEEKQAQLAKEPEASGDKNGAGTNKSEEDEKFKSSIGVFGEWEEEVEQEAQGMVASTNAAPPTEEVQKEALKWKAEGNAFFVKKQYKDAIESYTKAIQKNPLDATFYSNRSACYLAEKDFESALKDALYTRTVRADWPKGCYRLAMARLAQERFEEAANAAWDGVQLDQENDELKSLLQKCVRKGRREFLEKQKQEGAGSGGN